METVKKHKKSILLFMIALVLSGIMCFAFFQPHYPHDTYNIAKDGYT